MWDDLKDVLSCQRAELNPVRANRAKRKKTEKEPERIPRKTIKEREREREREKEREIEDRQTPRHPNTSLNLLLFLS